MNTRCPLNTGMIRLITADAEGNVLCVDQYPVIAEATTALQSEDSPELGAISPLFVGSLEDQNWWVLRIEKAAPLPPGSNLLPLRTIAASLPWNLLGIMSRAIQLVRFDHITTFCGRCGSPARMKEDELAKLCPNCGLLTFPRLSPAIIVRITDGDRILLARSPHFPTGMYSVLAGFIEPGESLEAGVHREVFEEVGLRITDLQYFGSQPWPYPDSLMIGFVARYLSGAIRCDEVEIEDAQWFTRDQMPELPGTLSIARTLIDDYVLK